MRLRSQQASREKAVDVQGLGCPVGKELKRHLTVASYS